MILILAINEAGQLLHFVLSPALCGEVQHEIVHVQKILNGVIPDAFLNALICRSSNGSNANSVRQSSLKDM